MGDEAERLTEQGEHAQALHDAGQCDGWCEWCEIEAEEAEAEDEALADGIEPLDFDHGR